MPKQPNLIDADKIAARIKKMKEQYPGPVGGAMYVLLSELESGSFDPTPPVQPDTEEVIKDE